MRIRSIPHLLLFSAFALTAQAADSVPPEESSAVPATAAGPAKEAMEAFQAGRHAEAVEMAKPLAEKGNAEALYLLGFAHETGNGAELSKDKALEYYRKAAAKRHQDATYRMAFILLASDEEQERNQAREALEGAAKDDPTVAARILGEAYLRGRLTEKPDPKQAETWWKSAADAGDIPSLLLLARLYEGQFGFPEMKDTKASMDAFTKAAELGDAGAMAALGSRFLSGDEKIRDEKKGREWLKKAMAAKETSAYLALGDYEENVKKDLKAALAAYERGKDAGQVDCILRAAEFYIDGKGTEKDVVRGMALLEQAAEAGSPAAHFRLAVAAMTGDTPDLHTGYKHLLAAANGNLVEAQNELGLLYLSGKLAGADTAAGVAWLTRAAQNGYAQAQNNLATLYERGAAGIPQNLENAGQLYSLAANQGHGPATLALARLIYNGVGTKADPVKAWALAKLAEERGVEDAKIVLKEIAGKLDDAQLTEAKKQLEDIKTGKAAEPQPEAKPEAKPQPKSEAKPKPDAKADAKPAAEAKPQRP